MTGGTKVLHQERSWANLLRVFVCRQEEMAHENVAGRGFESRGDSGQIPTASIISGSGGSAVVVWEGSGQ